MWNCVCSAALEGMSSTAAPVCPAWETSSAGLVSCPPLEHPPRLAPAMTTIANTTAWTPTLIHQPCPPPARQAEATAEPPTRARTACPSVPFDALSSKSCIQHPTFPLRLGTAVRRLPLLLVHQV